jgi:hypothetical protein
MADSVPTDGSGGGGGATSRKRRLGTGREGKEEKNDSNPNREPLERRRT